MRYVYVVGVDMSLYRTTDGRKIWYGRDLIAAQNKNKLPEAADVISDVFARFFGRHHTNGDQTHIAISDSLPCLDRHREFRAEAPWTEESGYDS